MPPNKPGQDAHGSTLRTSVPIRVTARQTCQQSLLLHREALLTSKCSYNFFVHGQSYSANLITIAGFYSDTCFIFFVSKFLSSQIRLPKELLETTAPGYCRNRSGHCGLAELSENTRKTGTTTQKETEMENWKRITDDHGASNLVGSPRGASWVRCLKNCTSVASFDVVLSHLTLYDGICARV